MFEKILEEKYPEYLQPGYGGMDCGLGWLKIIDVLLQTIAQHEKNLKRYRPHWFSNEYHPVRVEQIKEKFGGLRFYYSGGDDYVQGAVEMAEQWAQNTCELCGSPGTLRGLSWIRTLCDKHYEERKSA